LNDAEAKKTANAYSKKLTLKFPLKQNLKYSKVTFKK